MNWTKNLLSLRGRIRLVWGGVEDPRLVKIGDEYVLSFTGVHSCNRTPGLIAFSCDLKHWDWGGEVFPGRAIAITRERIGGYYYGYWGNGGVFLARSRDLRSWETLEEPVLCPRPGYFDAVLCESAAPPLLTDDGILLFYNGDRGGNRRKPMRVESSRVSATILPGPAARPAGRCSTGTTLPV